tara:strand:- start:1466 stop:1894 length:429 start_codon:yes stop_codon:yes gene_type:complete
MCSLQSPTTLGTDSCDFNRAIQFPSLDITDVLGKWAADAVGHERQRIKRDRLLQELNETGMLAEMETCQSSNSEYSEFWQQQHNIHQTVSNNHFIRASTHPNNAMTITKPTMRAICTNWGKSPIVISCSIIKTIGTVVNSVD